MKKSFCWLFLFLLTWGTVTWSACADADTPLPSDEAAVQAFDSLWGTPGIMADIVFSEDCFYVHVTKSDHGPVWSEWFYRCVYDAETASLLSQGNGIRMNCATSMETFETTRDIADEDGSAIFTINEDGLLIWSDLTADEGDGFLMTKMGRFEGTWVCDDTMIEFIAFDRGIYRAIVTRHGTSGNEGAFFCCYDAASQAAVSYSHKSVSFMVDADGQLIWVDEIHHEGDGYVFTHMTSPDDSWINYVRR